MVFLVWQGWNNIQSDLRWNQCLMQSNTKVISIPFIYFLLFFHTHYWACTFLQRLCNVFLCSITCGRMNDDCVDTQSRKNIKWSKPRWYIVFMCDWRGYGWSWVLIFDCSSRKDLAPIYSQHHRLDGTGKTHRNPQQVTITIYLRLITGIFRRALSR